MPRIIHPEITGTVSITLSIEDATTLASALDNVLDQETTTWHDQKIRTLSSGTTCNDFLKALDKAINRS